MPVGAPRGNQNNRNAKLWRQALDRALEKRGRGDRTAALDDLAEKFLRTVESVGKGTADKGPSVAGFNELADRLDGRPAQDVSGDLKIGGAITWTHKIG